MICVGLSNILYPGGTLGENSCIVCAALHTLDHITLYVDNVYVH